MGSKIDFKDLIESCPGHIKEHFTHWFTHLAEDVLEAEKWEEDTQTDIFSILCKLDLSTFNWNTKGDYCIKTFRAQLSDVPLYAVSISKIINILDCSHEYFAYVSCPEKDSYRIFPIPVNKSASFESLLRDIIVMVNYEKFDADPLSAFDLMEHIMHFDRIITSYHRIK